MLCRRFATIAAELAFAFALVETLEVQGRHWEALEVGLLEVEVLGVEVREELLFHQEVVGEVAADQT